MSVNLRTVVWILLPLLSIACDPGQQAQTLADPVPISTPSAPAVDAGVEAVDSADAGAPETVESDAALPRLNSIFPARSALEGGVSVRIVGQQFVLGTTVLFGERSCADVEIVSENHIQCTVPPSERVGPTDVTVAWPDDSASETLSGAFTYYRPVQLERVDPPRGPASGGARLTLRGSGFLDSSEVAFGDASVRMSEVSEDGTMATVICPSGEPGTVDVVVQNINGEARLENAFTWYEDLVVEEITPAWGSVAGQEEIQLIGLGLTAQSVVSFDGEDGETGPSALERRSLTVRTPPAQKAGPVDVVVSNENGQYPVYNGFLYVDQADGEFAVSGFVPNRLPAASGGRFLVGGNGFTENTVVTVDERQVSCQFMRAQLLECQVGPRPVGAFAVRVAEGNAWTDWPDGLSFYDAVEVFDVVPPRGSIAGGAVIEITGRGFFEGVEFSVEGRPLEVIEVRDEQTVLAITPPNPAGWVALKAESPDDLAVLPQAFEYFDPSAGFGGVWGEPIVRAVNVTTMDAMSGERIDGATIVVDMLGTDLRWSGLTDERGLLTLSDPQLALPVAVTAAKEGYTATTFERVTAENVTILMMSQQPPMGMGMMEPEPPIYLSGAIRGMSDLAKPNEEGYVLVTFVETTHNEPGNRLEAGPPMPNGLLLEDGPFRIVSRQGELAVIAVAGYVQSALKAQYDAGQIPYWTFRDSLEPIAMGMRRFLTVAPGDTVADIDIELDHMLDRTISVELDNPSAGQPGAPTNFTANAILQLGADGFYDFRNQVSADEPRMLVRRMPRLTDWADPDIRMRWEGEAEQTDPEFSYKYAWAYQTVRDMANGVIIGPFAANVHMVSPTDEGNLGLLKWVEWEELGGLLGPARPPEPADIHLARISNQRSILWTHWVPGAATRFQYTPIPDGDGQRSGLPIGPLQLSIYSIKVDGQFSFEDFTYDDLNRMRALSWTSIIFFN